MLRYPHTGLDCALVLYRARSPFSAAHSTPTALRLRSPRPHATVARLFLRLGTKKKGGCHTPAGHLCYRYPARFAAYRHATLRCLIYAHLRSGGLLLFHPLRGCRFIHTRTTGGFTSCARTDWICLALVAEKKKKTYTAAFTHTLQPSSAPYGLTHAACLLHHTYAPRLPLAPRLGVYRRMAVG